MNGISVRRASALSLSLIGLDVHQVHVTAEVEDGPAATFRLAGLTEASAREARVRVRAALQQSGCDVTDHAVSVNLAPGDLAKSGGGFDLAVAAAVLAASGRVPAGALAGVAMLGELSFTGAIRPVRGVLPALRGAIANGIELAIVPRGNAREAANVAGIKVGVAGHLAEVVTHLKGERSLDGPGKGPAFEPDPPEAGIDLADIRGQNSARRVLEIAAAGAHHTLLSGPPGSGKTVLARRLPTILPPMHIEEALEVSAIYSVAGLPHVERGLVTLRPFRAPHHTVSAAGLVGGGQPVRPGEVSLAHHGCLFLDSFPDFRRDAIETLSQALADGQSTIYQTRARVTFPARPQMVVALTPCPCGFAGDQWRRCSCSVDRVRTYRARPRGPLLDLVDLQAQIPPADMAQLSSTSPGECSATVRARVIAARAIQRARVEAREVTAPENGRLTPEEVARVAVPDEAGARLLSQAEESLGWPSPVRNRVLRVARTVADLDGSTAVRGPHVAEALQVAHVEHGG